MLKNGIFIHSQVFGELIENYQSDSQRSSEQRGSSDLREHMVGILFSRRKLNNLQKQVTELSIVYVYGVHVSSPLPPPMDWIDGGYNEVVVC